MVNHPESYLIHTNENSSHQVSLYFHIPFCTKKCPYCHFYVIPNRTPFHELLLEGLSLEIARQTPLLQGKEIVSIYFGGGTPSLFAPKGIKEILKMLFSNDIQLSENCEITLEANPERGSLSLFEQLKEMGINRLSLGVQSLDDRSLQTLERIHNAQKAKETIKLSQQAGFDNISIDLMYDLPDQTLQSFQYTLSQIEALSIQHLSLYNLTVEPHTSFYKRKESLKFPSQKTSVQFLKCAIDTFESIGLERYEISAFSKPGFESRHNLGYWTGRPFLGFGPSAFSFWNGKRFRNIANIQRYVRNLRNDVSPIDFEEKLPYPDNLKEHIAVHLRLLSGILLKSFLPHEVELSLEKLITQKLLVKKGTRIFLSKKGLLFYDSVASEIV